MPEEGSRSTLPEAVHRVKGFAGWVFVLGLCACRDEREALEPARATGSVEGRILVSGETPPSTRVTNTTDPEVCGRSHTLEDLVVSSDGGVRYAIVSLGGVPEDAIPALEPDDVVIDNTECRFTPHASVATVGSILEAVNDDPVLHTTHLYGPADVNISLPVRGARSTRRLDRPGLYVVKCDIHGWMQAFLRVDPHPFHAVTDDEGRFRIEGVPEGRYTFEVWHEKLGARELPVDVRAGVSSKVTVEYSIE
jgi:plastocyanin